jgi:putative ABC transport system permease protein
MRRRLSFIWSALFRRSNTDRDIADEILFHIDSRAADLMCSGLPHNEAARRARLEFGGIEKHTEKCRDTRGLPFFDSLLRDIRYALQIFRRNPGFTVAATAMLALGIGINTIVFTLTNAVLFKGFPGVVGNDRILYMTTGRGCCVSWPDFKDWQAQAKSFEGMALVHGTKVTFNDRNGFPERYDATEVTHETFGLVGQRPALGRDFTLSDEAPGAVPVVILRYAFWERRYAKDPAVVGRTVRMNGVPTTIIGVMPQGFSFPQNQDLWVPLIPEPELLKRDKRDTWFVFGRMAKGVTLKTARAEMETIGRRLGIAYPLTNSGQNMIPRVLNFRGFFIGPNATLTYAAMLGAVGFVLLIACANLANLLLARAMSRSREISVRIALGAGRWRIVRQLLIESVMLSGLGGCFGWLIARWGVKIYALAPNGSGISDQIFGGVWFDNILDYSMDYRVLSYLIATSIGTGLLFGLAPALRLSNLDLNATLKDGGRGSTGGWYGRRLSSLLIIAEMALAVVLLVGAGVMIRSFLNVYSAPLGFRSENILTALISLPKVRYSRTDAESLFYNRLEARLKAIRGVRSIAISSALPGRSAALSPYEVTGAQPAGLPGGDERSRPMVTALVVSPDYFETLGVALFSGRAFNRTDGTSDAQVAIVNRRFSSQHWRGENPVGKRLRLFRGQKPEPWLTVAGVVSDIAQNGATWQEFDPVVYLPYRQSPALKMWVMARTFVPPGSLAIAVQREIQTLDPDLPISLGPGPLAERLAPAWQYRGLTAALFLIFALIALLLASIGLYAVTAHLLSRRTQEIGIRMALGASANHTLKLVLGQGMLPVVAGLIIGLAASLAVNRVLKSVLVLVSPSDPIAIAGAFSVLMLAATLGCLIPARRAMRVDPVVALRHE